MRLALIERRRVVRVVEGELPDIRPRDAVVRLVGRRLPDQLRIPRAVDGGGVTLRGSARPCVEQAYNTPDGEKREARSKITSPVYRSTADELPLKHDTFKDRYAQMLTDGMRGLLMESEGYRTRVIEFISDAHTHRNVMIVAVRDPSAVKGEGRLAEVQALKTRYRIDHQSLETLLRG
jgi:hypothetical protein